LAFRTKAIIGKNAIITINLALFRNTPHNCISPLPNAYGTNDSIALFSFIRIALQARVIVMFPSPIPARTVGS
jgi:hypothetical protein